MSSEIPAFAAASMQPRARLPLLAIFLGALAVRWVYDLALFAGMGDAGLTLPDSRGYLALARVMADGMQAGAIRGWDWLGADLAVMPLITWMFTACVALFGDRATLAYVLLQGALDAGTCLLISGTARTFDPRFAVPAGVAAALNPTQIVMSGFVLTDTPFLFFIALSLFASVKWLRSPSWTGAWLIGVGLGAAALVRILVVPWTVFLVLFLLAARALCDRVRARNVGQVTLVAALVFVCVAPILVRNVTQYGSFALTPQTGGYVGLWIAPLVKESKDGTLWENGAADVQKRVQERFGAEPASSRFEASRRLTAVGWELLSSLGPAAIAKAWIFGAAINLGSPAIILSPPIYTLPRTGFYNTPGDTRLSKISNFMFRSTNSIYAIALLLGLAGLALVRLIQAVGLFALLRTPGSLMGLLLFGAWIGFVLAVNGPVATPKYRLPIEPPLMVLAGAGLCALRDWRRRRG